MPQFELNIPSFYNKPPLNLSPSLIELYLNCPYSAIANYELNPRKGIKQVDEWTDEGIKAHEAAAQRLNSRLKGCVPILYNDAKLEYAVDYYDKYFFHFYNQYNQCGEIVDVAIEKDVSINLDFVVSNQYAITCNGRVDSAIITDQDIHVFDLKSGDHEGYEAQNNPQLLAYAVALHQKYMHQYPNIKQITLHIIQPNIPENPCNNWTLTVSDLIRWHNSTFMTMVNTIANGTARQCGGEYCNQCRGFNHGCVGYFKSIGNVFDELKNATNNYVTNEQLSDIAVKGLNRLQEAEQVLKQLSISKIEKGENIDGIGIAYNDHYEIDKEKFNNLIEHLMKKNIVGLNCKDDFYTKKPKNRQELRKHFDNDFDFKLNVDPFSKNKQRKQVVKK